MTKLPVPKTRGLSSKKVFIFRFIIRSPWYFSYRIRVLNRRLRLIDDFGRVVLDPKVKMKNKLINMVLFKKLQKRTKRKKKYYQRKMLDHIK